MKKLIAIFTMLLVCFVVSICQASAIDECALGGITMGVSKDAVRNIYGEPTKKKLKGVEEWIYGDSFSIKFSEGYVTSITTDENNGIKMPAGFTVGSDAKGLVKYFGQNYGLEPKRYSGDDMDYISYVVFRPDQSGIILRVGYDYDNDKICFINMYATGIS